MQPLSNEDCAFARIERRFPVCCAALCLLVLGAGTAQGQKKIVLSRGEATVMLEPYAPNILRVTLSLNKADATSAPGYGIVAHDSSSGWTEETGKNGDVM